MSLFSSTLLLITLLVFGFAASASKTEILDLQNEIIQVDQKNRKLLLVLDQLQSSLAKASRKRAQLEGKIQNTKEEYRSSAEEFEALDAQTIQEKKRLSSRLISIYKIGVNGFLRLLFDGNSQSDYQRNMRVISQLVMKEMKALKKYAKDRSSLKVVRLKVERKLMVLENEKQQVNLAEKELTKKLRLQTRAIEALKMRMSQSLTQLRKIRKNLSPEQQELLSGLIYPSLFENKGKLDWPTAGLVLRQFGWVDTPTQSIKVRHRGWFIASATMQGVNSVSDGKVSYVGLMPGYNNLVIISHGMNFYTVYGNLKKVNVKVGQEVARQSIIGYTGQDTFWDSTGLYFEIRHFNEPQNPKEWLAKRRNTFIGSL